jgi:hypothetical protein
MRSLCHMTAALVAVCLSLAAAPAVYANTFTMSSCTAGQIRHHPWNGSSTRAMWASDDCQRGDGLVTWADIAYGPNLPYASDAKCVLSVPATLKIRRIRGEIRLNQGAGWAAGLFDESNGSWLYGGPPCLGQCGNGVFTVFDLQGLNSSAVSFVMLCYAGVCNPVMTSAIRNLEATIEDTTPPELGLTGGGLLTGNWVRGDASVAFRARDDAGVERTEVFVDGQRRGADDETCDRIVIPVCDPDVERSIPLSTKLFSGDGPHTLTVRAIDVSGQTTDSSWTVRADNTAPIAPLGLSNASGEWTSTNRFALRWTNPSQVNGAPIAGAVWRACPAGRAGECVTGHRDGTNLSEITDLSVPAPGQWRVAVALQDAAGNTDARNASELVLGFDDTPPDVAIVPTNPEDPTRLQVAADDDGAPIVRGDVELRRHGSRVWRGVSTRVADIGLEAVIDDEVLASGDYDVRAHAWNAAGWNARPPTGRADKPRCLPCRCASRRVSGSARQSIAAGIRGLERCSCAAPSSRMVAGCGSRDSSSPPAATLWSTCQSRSARASTGRRPRGGLSPSCGLIGRVTSAMSSLAGRVGCSASGTPARRPSDRSRETCRFGCARRHRWRSAGTTSLTATPSASAGASAADTCRPASASSSSSSPGVNGGPSRAPAPTAAVAGGTRTVSTGAAESFAGSSAL